VKRRDFNALLCGTAFAWPFAAIAQREQSVPVIGYLNGATLAGSANLLAAFRKGLSETGYVERQNVAIEYRWADEQYDRLPALATDLVRRPVTVIAATSTPAALAAKAATATIPIVFSVGNDPVKVGLVTNLGRPDGNVTGVTRFNVELAPKRLELLHDAIPAATVVALLVNPSNPNAETLSRDLQGAARTLGLQLHALRASTEADFNAAFAKLIQLRAGALVIGADPVFNSRSEQLAALALRHAVPAMYQYREFAAAGGLMSYGASNTDSHRQLGVYAGRILAGARLADLPVQQSTKVELIINLKTARALGLTIPQSLLLRADEVIQ
jgi:putative ABC transport system substrate-binding protein